MQATTARTLTSLTVQQLNRGLQRHQNDALTSFATAQGRRHMPSSRAAVEGGERALTRAGDFGQVEGTCPAHRIPLGCRLVEASLKADLGPTSLTSALHDNPNGEPCTKWSTGRHDIPAVFPRQGTDFQSSVVPEAEPSLSQPEQAEPSLNKPTYATAARSHVHRIG